MQYDMQHLRALRLFELNRVLEYLPPRGDVLEVGAGAGWQSEHLCSLGYEVEAVDLGGSSIFESERSFPIRTYDGHTLPFPDDSFDAIFSSNVLEHVPHIEALLPETARVLRPGGHAVHVLPTSAWRLWTIAAHYPAMAKQAGVRLAHRGTPPAEKSDGGHEPRASSGARLSQILLPARHGEQGNAVSEVPRHDVFQNRRIENVFGKLSF